MHAQGRLGDEDFELLELLKQRFLQVGNETATPARSKVKRRHHDYAVEIKTSLALPNPVEWEPPLLHYRKLIRRLIDK